MKVEDDSLLTLAITQEADLPSTYEEYIILSYICMSTRI